MKRPEATLKESSAVEACQPSLRGRHIPPGSRPGIGFFLQNSGLMELTLVITGSWAIASDTVIDYAIDKFCLRPGRIVTPMDDKAFHTAVRWWASKNSVPVIPIEANGYDAHHRNRSVNSAVMSYIGKRQLAGDDVAALVMPASEGAKAWSLIYRLKGAGIPLHRFSLERYREENPPRRTASGVSIRRRLQSHSRAASYYG